MGSNSGREDTARWKEVALREAAALQSEATSEIITVMHVWN